MVFSLVAFLLKHPMYPSFHNHGSEQLPERKLILEGPIFHFHEYGKKSTCPKFLANGCLRLFLQICSVKDDVFVGRFPI